MSVKKENGNALARLLAAGAVALVAVPGMAMLIDSGDGGGAAAASPGLSGAFITPCGFSHRAKDDPIVYPGAPGRSHSHDFFGNTSTDAHSTLDSLRASRFLCLRDGDRSAYWVPTLYVRGRARDPRNAIVYYRNARRDPHSIRPFPQGLRVVAGSSRARVSQDPTVMNWNCVPRALAERRRRGGRGEPRRIRRRIQAVRRELRALKGLRDKESAEALRQRRRVLLRRVRRLEQRALGWRDSTVTACPRGTSLNLTVSFPECWDGRRLDSADHRSHLAYATSQRGQSARTCPASHPVPVPQLILHVRYRTRGGRDARLSSGPMRTAHADFFNAWDERSLADLVQRCLTADVFCRRS